jgi:hypothetical protein
MSLLSRLAVQAARAYGVLSAVDKNRLSANYLVVAGGGGGGVDDGGGGGAGGYQSSTFSLSTLNTYSITVGAGGTAPFSTTNGGNGSNSVVSGTGLTTLTSVGGGAGGSSLYGRNGFSGGSGGGGSGYAGGTGTGGAGTSGQGNAGGTSSTNQQGAGGGGAGAVGGNGGAGTGGVGLANSISGSSVYYAGGGGSCSLKAGGLGGGGTGAQNTGGGTAATAGTANTGGGGGAASAFGPAGAAGGSGVVIISYASATPKFVGGTLTTSGGNQIHTFTSSGTLSPITPITASYLVVAGGGGAGRTVSGGGGGGGYLTSSTTLYSGATYVVTVGGGGAVGATLGARGTNGGNSVISGTGLTTITSLGGGGGGADGTGTVAERSGNSGGSGGGAVNVNGVPGAGTSGQGNAGGNGSTNCAGGGGGAGAVGGNGSGNIGGTGGNGLQSSISGTATYYAGGGGGGGYNTASTNAGGLGGGGNGTNDATNSTAGTTNSGGGGGGAGFTGAPAGTSASGGSGIVIISYAGSQAFNGGLVTSSGGNTIHTFTSSGALTPLTNNLTNSLRFRKSANAYLSRTPTVTGNRKTFTWSGWVKRGEIAVSGTSDYALMCVRPSSPSYTLFSIRSANAGTGPYAIIFEDSASTCILATSNKFRDVSAWYHFVLAVDTTQATAANRVKIYVNGNQVTSFDTYNTYPTLNSDMLYNTTNPHNIGRDPFDTATQFDGYMTDINFIDGQALEPYYFGNNDANGVWKPILYKGTYGTNGFYLKFADTSAATAAAIGKDSSGNGNNWTPNNISVTAGTTYDAMTDVPTNTSATTANYCVMNPLKPTSGAASLTEGNLKYTYSSGTGNNATVPATIGINSGKWYHEITITSGVNFDTGYYSSETGFLSLPTAVYFTYYSNGSTAGIASSTGTVTGTPSALAVNDVIGIAFDYDNGSVTFYKNNVSQGTITGLTTNGVLLFPTYTIYSAGTGATTVVYNFGQRPFSYTPPTGFVALNTYNLPTPTILQGNKYMDATLYTGNGSTQAVVNQGQFKPDLVWMKNRGSAQDHTLLDSIRGTTTFLISNWDGAQTTAGDLSISYNSNGFSAIGANARSNASSNTYVGWQWQAGQGSTSTNTSGSVTSTTSVNTTAGFSIVTYTGPGSGGGTVGHGLGVAPRMIIVKNRNAVESWRVGHAFMNAGSSPWNYYMNLNGTGAQAAASSVWNNTAPTSTVFSIANDAGVSGSGNGLVAYCFAEIAGFSKFGFYTGNGSADGVFVYTGFRPKWILIKNASNGVQGWTIQDTSRSTYNVVDNYLLAQANSAEQTTYAQMDYLSNGFKVRTSDALVNGSGNTIIYAAFAEHPFKNANAR